MERNFNPFPTFYCPEDNSASKTSIYIGKKSPICIPQMVSPPSVDVICVLRILQSAKMHFNVCSLTLSLGVLFFLKNNVIKFIIFHSFSTHLDGS